MYREHPELEIPSLETIVWRYMDLEKFKSIIAERALYFSRLDKLADPFEGSLPYGNKGGRLARDYDHRGQLLENYKKNGINIPQVVFENLFRKKYDGPSALEQFRLTHFVNCWHINEAESDAMWNLYIKTNKGIAIKTSLKNIISSLNTDIEVHIGKIRYINYKTDKLPERNVLPFLMAKRAIYKHENELRLLATFLPYSQLPQRGFKLHNNNGLLIDIELEKFFGSVVVGPNLGKKEIDECKSVIKNSKLEVPLTYSELFENPMF